MNSRSMVDGKRDLFLPLRRWEKAVLIRCGYLLPTIYIHSLKHIKLSGLHHEMDFTWIGKKKVQDSLSHSKDIFESGASFFGKKGYWRLVKGIPEPEKLQHNQSVPVNITSTDHLQIPIIDMKESNVTATLESQRIPTLEINTEFKVPAPMKRNKHHESSHNTRITTNSTPLNAINLNTALPTMQKVTVQPLPMAMHSEIGSLLQTRDIVGKVDGAADNILSKDFEHFLMRSGIKKNFFQGYSATV